MFVEGWRVGENDDFSSSRRTTITGEDAICDYFVSKCSNQSLLGGDDAATVKEWRQIAASITK